ncbi:hypothetical protein M8C21_002899, partial [Ambrosia artemisiifolia]
MDYSMFCVTLPGVINDLFAKAVLWAFGAGVDGCGVADVPSSCCFSSIWFATLSKRVASMLPVTSIIVVETRYLRRCFHHGCNTNELVFHILTDGKL